MKKIFFLLSFTLVLFSPREASAVLNNPIVPCTGIEEPDADAPCRQITFPQPGQILVILSWGFDSGAGNPTDFELMVGLKGTAPTDTCQTVSAWNSPVYPGPTSTSFQVAGLKSTDRGKPHCWKIMARDTTNPSNNSSFVYGPEFRTLSAPTSSVSDSVEGVTDAPANVEDTITFSVTWSDPGDQTEIHICKNDVAPTNQNCDGSGSWCDTTTFAISSPTTCTYTALIDDVGTQDYYAFACDQGDLCSGSSFGQFTVNDSGGGDTTAPIVSSFSPKDGDSIAVNTDLVITFDEAVTAQAGNIVINDSTGAVQTIAANDAALVTVSGSTVTIDPPTDLVAGDYYINIDAGAFQDTAEPPNDYAGISGSTTWNFTTVATPGGVGPAPTLGNPISSANLTELFNKILNFLFGLAIFLVPVIVIYAAFLFLGAGGDPEKLQKARIILLWTAIAFIIILLSRGFPVVLRNLL